MFGLVLILWFFFYLPSFLQFESDFVHQKNDQKNGGIAHLKKLLQQQFFAGLHGLFLLSAHRIKIQRQTRVQGYL